MINNVHFSSKSDEWETPQDLFDKLNALHNFTLDVCASNENNKCLKYTRLSPQHKLLTLFGQWRNSEICQRFSKFLLVRFSLFLQCGVLCQQSLTLLKNGKR